jgi:hypothetical protein
MKKNLTILLPAVFFILSGWSQTNAIKKTVPQEKGIGVSVGVNKPIGTFSSTHFIGMAVEVAPSGHSFGLIKARKFAFTYNGGFAYYFGKKETISSYPYKYPGYSFIHGFAGLRYTPFLNTGISLTAGPALGIYNGTTRFTIGSKLDASYFINSKIALGPGIVLMKEPGAAALWSLAIRGSIRF